MGILKPQTTGGRKGRKYPYTEFYNKWMKERDDCKAENMLRFHKRRNLKRQFLSISDLSLAIAKYYGINRYISIRYTPTGNLRPWNFWSEYLSDKV